MSPVQTRSLIPPGRRTRVIRLTFFPLAILAIFNWIYPLLCSSNADFFLSNHCSCCRTRDVLSPKPEVGLCCTVEIFIRWRQKKLERKVRLDFEYLFVLLCKYWGRSNASVREHSGRGFCFISIHTFTICAGRCIFRLFIKSWGKS